jgi:hypothetical protein
MKKVLIVANIFLGSTRVPALIKFLPEYGWQPVLLSPEPGPGQQFPPGVKVITTRYRDVQLFWKRLFGLKPGKDPRGTIKQKLGTTPNNKLMDFLLNSASSVINYPDNEKGWRSFAVKAGNDLLNGEKFDAILSSSSPVTAHVIAGKLKTSHHIPWLADFRDLWTQNHNYSYGSLRKSFEKRLEHKTIAPADALVTVSKLWAQQVSEFHHNKRSFSITNGFDPATLNDPPAPLSPRFVITYTGRVYTGKQNPAPLFTALKELIAQNIIAPQDLEVRFYGTGVQWLTKTIRDAGLTDIVKEYPAVKQDAVAGLLHASQVLWLMNWEDRNIKGWHPLKGFEYLAAMRPILATGGFSGDATEALLQETGAGIYCTAVEQVKEALRKWYTEYKLTGKVSFNGSLAEINRYNHHEMARQFAAALNHVTEG